MLIYFAGHGFVSGRGLSGALRSRPEEHRWHRLSHGDARHGDRHKIKAKWKVLLTDACHSGAITPDADAMHQPGLLGLSAPCSRLPRAATASARSRARIGAAGTASSLTTSSRVWKARPTKSATAS